MPEEKVAKHFSLGNMKNSMMEYISIVAIILLLIIFTIINPRFLSMKNISNLLADMSTLLVIGIGMTFVLLVGSIDLSIGAICSCACVIFAVSIPKFGGASYLIAILFGAVAGFVNGFLHGKLRMPSFIATFGTMCVWESCAMLISGGASQQIKKTFSGLITWHKMKVGVLPLPFIIAVILLAIMLVVQNRTQFGKTMYAVGGCESAARAIGLKVIDTKIIIFTVAGLFGAVGGVLLACKLKSGIPTIGEPFNMMAIAAVALGGTSMSGGKGGLVKTIAGVILITLIQNGMNVIGISAFWQDTTFGVIILLSVWLTTDRKRRQLIVK